MTVLALATTYAGATLALLDNQLTTSVGAAGILMLPLPLWLAGIYFLMLTVAGGVRTASALDLESQVVQIANLKNLDLPHLGLRGTSGVRGVRTATGPVRVALAVTYIGIGVLLLLYAIYMVDRATTQPHGWWFWPASAFLYVGLVTVVVTSTISASKYAGHQRETAASIAIGASAASQTSA